MTASPVDALISSLAPASRIYLQGACGEHPAFRDIIAAAAERTPMVVSCLLPGMNRYDYTALGVELTAFLMSPDLRQGEARGRLALLPLSYSGIGRYLAASPLDVALLHLSPPNANGLCSFGICSDFGPTVARRARLRIGVLNPSMPAAVNGPSIPVSELDVVLHIDAPLMEMEPVSTGALADAIGVIVAGLVPDGASLQVGIGNAPIAAVRALRSHRNLRFATGMLTPDYFDLDDAGALAADGGHTTGIAYGHAEFYARATADQRIRFVDTTTSHNEHRISGLPRFTAINSALEVDLFGQANLEWRAGRMVSGVGGAPDFIRGAARSEGGRAIVALPSTAGTEMRISRIVAKLNVPSVSLGRSDADTVVTEYGAASLKGLSLDQRAQALIAIAAPKHQAQLERDWSQLRAGL